MNRYTIKISNRFWETAKALRSKYTHEQFAEIIAIIRDCINELAEKGFVDENGWVTIAALLLHRSTLHCYSVPWQAAT